MVGILKKFLGLDRKVFKTLFGFDTMNKNMEEERNCNFFVYYKWDNYKLYVELVSLIISHEIWLYKVSMIYTHPYNLLYKE